MSVEPAIGTQLGPVQLALAAERARGWLLYDLRGKSLVAARLLGLSRPTERRFFYWIPTEGLPVAIVHEDDASGLPELPGERVRYRTAIELRSALEAHVPREGMVLLEQAPFAQIADLALVDEATLSLLRGRDTIVRSSLELANRFAGPLEPDERDEVTKVVADLGALRAALARAVSQPFSRWGELYARVEAEAAARMLVLDDESGLAIDMQARGQRAVERDGGEIAAGVCARLDLWARRKDGASSVLVPASIELAAGQEPEAHAKLASVLRACEDELLAALAERAARPRVLGSEVGELAWASVRRRGLALTSACAGWPLGPIARGSHACTFDAEGFADPRELVPGTHWVIRLGVDDGHAIAWRTALIERLEGGLRVVSRGGDGCLVVRPA